MASQVLLCLIVIPSAIYDYRWRRVPNWITLPGIVLGVALNYFVLGLLASLEGLGLAVAIYGLLYLLHAIGGGDLKLMAALGAVAGPAHWLRIFILTALAGGLAALVYIVFRGRFRHTLSNMGVIVKSLARGKPPHRVSPELDVRTEAGARVPQAVMIACATVVYLCLMWLAR